MISVLQILKDRTLELDEQADEVKRKANNISKLIDSVCEVLEDSDLKCVHVEDIDHKLNEKLKERWDTFDLTTSSKD